MKSKLYPPSKKEIGIQQMFMGNNTTFQFQFNFKYLITKRYKNQEIHPFNLCGVYLSPPTHRLQQDAHKKRMYSVFTIKIHTQINFKFQFSNTTTIIITSNHLLINNGQSLLSVPYS